MKWIYGVTISLFAVGCTHLSVTKDVLTPDYLLAKGSKQITFLGDNDHPRFSNDGTRLLYSSRARGIHKGSQIYEMDLLRNKERRVTFSDGDAFDAIYISRSEILYASTTDEIKESPLLNKTFDKDYPPSDLYISDLYGTNILRLSPQPGFDAEPLFLSTPAKPAIVFASRRGDLMGIYRVDLKHMPVSLISAQKDKEKRFPTLTPDQLQMAWVEKDLKTNEQSVVLFKLKNKIPFVLKKGRRTVSRFVLCSPSSPKAFFIVFFAMAKNSTSLKFMISTSNALRLFLRAMTRCFLQSFPMTLRSAWPSRVYFKIKNKFT